MTTQSEVKSPEWVMAELIPESLKKKAKLATKYCHGFNKAGSECRMCRACAFPQLQGHPSLPAHFGACRNLSHIPHVHTKRSQIPSPRNGSPGKAGIPSGQAAPGLINTGKESLGFGTAQPGHAPSGDTKNPTWEHKFCLKSGNRTAQSSLRAGTAPRDVCG